MVIRVLRGRVNGDRVDAFHDRARRALAEARPENGCAWAQMGRQVHQDRTEEIVMVTVWASIEALYAWVGGRDLLGTPFVYGSDAPDVFATYDVQHYESMDLCPDLDSGLLGVPFWSRDQAS